MSLARGDHHFGIQDLSQAAFLELARYAARQINGGDPDENLEPITAFCSCREPDCDLARTYGAGMAVGLRTGAVAAMAYAAADQARAQRENGALLLPPEIKVSLVMQPSPGVVLEYDAAGKVLGTRPR
jgi:hypothetical protein